MKQLQAMFLNFTCSKILVGLLLIGFCMNAKAQIKYGDNKAAGHYLNTRGIKLYYESYGEGPPLLLLHINGGSMKLFSNQIPYFSKRYHVIAVDSLHLKSCYVIGWSDGGISGLVLAMRHPDKVKKLAVSGPNLWPDTTALVPFVYHYLERTADSLKKLPPTAENKNQLKIVELDLLEPHIKLSQLHSIKCPTLVIGGDHDGIPTEHLLQIHQHIPKSYLWIVPNSSHFVATSKKDQFSARITEFFKEPYREIEGMDILQ